MENNKKGEASGEKNNMMVQYQFRTKNMLGGKKTE